MKKSKDCSIFRSKGGKLSRKDLSQLNESIEKNKQEKEKNLEEKKQIQESINTMTVLMNELKEKIVQNEKGVFSIPALFTV